MEPHPASSLQAPSTPGDLVDELLRVQQLIAQRADPSHIYQAVVEGALRLLHGNSGALRFLDLEDASWMVAVAGVGTVESGERWRRRAPITEGASGRAIARGELVSIEAIQRDEMASRLAPPDLQAAIAVPVRERDKVIGALVVGTSTPGRRWSARERELLRAYGEHMSVVLTVARASHAV